MITSASFIEGGHEPMPWERMEPCEPEAFLFYSWTSVKSASLRVQKPYFSNKGTFPSDLPKMGSRYIVTQTSTVRYLAMRMEIV